MPLVGFYLQPAVGGVELGVVVLGPLRGHRAGRRHQGRAVQPLPHARRAARHRRGGGRGAGRTSTRATTTTSCSTWSRRSPIRDRPRGRLRFRGGLLGHWSVWTQGAVALLERCQSAAPRRRRRRCRPARPRRPRHRLQRRLLRRRQRLPRLHRRLPRGAAPPGPARGHRGAWIPAEGLSPGQAGEIDRVCREHADLADDAFVAANLRTGSAGRRPPRLHTGVGTSDSGGPGGRTPRGGRVSGLLPRTGTARCAPSSRSA